MRRRSSTRLRAVAVVPALLMLLGPSAAARAADLSAAHALRPTREHAWLARVLADTPARALPGRGPRVGWATRAAPYWGGRNVLLVTGGTRRHGVLYLRVLLKQRPAGSAGWLPAAAVRLHRTDRRVVVDLSRRTVTLLRAGRRLLVSRAVVGAAATPTPVGLFAVDAPVRQPARARVGRRVLALAAYSRTLTEFQGGTPQVALHAYEYLGAPLGSAASHGCIRLPEQEVHRLIRQAPRGTPVLIRR